MSWVKSSAVAVEHALFSIFGGVSIGLTVIGIVGLIILTVNWRRREIAARLALAAQRRDVVSLIAIQSLKGR